MSGEGESWLALGGTPVKLISVFLVCCSSWALIRNAGAENKAAKFVFAEQEGAGENSPDSCALCRGGLRAFPCFIQDCLVWLLRIRISVFGSGVIEVVLISNDFIVISLGPRERNNRALRDCRVP